MKTSMFLTGLCVALGLTMGLTSGCASSGPRRVDKAVASAEDLHADYGRLKRQVNTTVEALTGVMNAKPEHLESAYETYVDELAALDAQNQVVTEQAKDLRSHTVRQLSAWKKQMRSFNNPGIQRDAEQRIAETETQLNRVRDELAGFREDFETFLYDLQRISSRLENNLTPTGVKALTGIIQAAKEEEGPVTTNIDATMELLGKMAQALSS